MRPLFSLTSLALPQQQSLSGATAALGRHAITRVIDQDLPHRAAGQGEKVVAAGDRVGTAAGHAQIAFVYQRGGIQRAGTTSAHGAARESQQFVVKQHDHALPCVGISVSRTRQQLRRFAHVTASRCIRSSESSNPHGAGTSRRAHPRRLCSIGACRECEACVNLTTRRKGRRSGWQPGQSIVAGGSTRHVPGCGAGDGIGARLAQVSALVAQPSRLPRVNTRSPSSTSPAACAGCSRSDA